MNSTPCAFVVAVASSFLVMLLMAIWDVRGKARRKQARPAPRVYVARCMVGGSEWPVNTREDREAK